MKAADHYPNHKLIYRRNNHPYPENRTGREFRATALGKIGLGPGTGCKNKSDVCFLLRKNPDGDTLLPFVIPDPRSAARIENQGMACVRPIIHLFASDRRFPALSAVI